MGLFVADLSADACREAGIRSGVLVVEVEPGGPADKRGIEEGDIITQYEHEPVHSAAWFYGRVRRDGEGFLAGVHVLRDGSERWMGFVILAAAPPPPPSAQGIDERFTAMALRIDALEARIAELEGTTR
jgi:serine protease Do